MRRISYYVLSLLLFGGISLAKPDEPTGLIGNLGRLLTKGKSHLQNLKQKYLKMDFLLGKSKKSKSKLSKYIKESKKLEHLESFEDEVESLTKEVEAAEDLDVEQGGTWAESSSDYVPHAHLKGLGKSKMKYLRRRRTDMERRIEKFAKKVEKSNNLAQIRKLRDSLVELKKFDLGEHKKYEKLYLMRLHKAHEEMSEDMKKMIVQDDDDALKNFYHQRKNRVPENLKENQNIQWQISLNLDEPMDSYTLMQQSQNVAQGDAIVSQTQSFYYQIYRKIRIYDKRDYPEQFQNSFINPQNMKLFLAMTGKVEKLKQMYLDQHYGKDRGTPEFMKVLATNNVKMDAIKIFNTLGIQPGQLNSIQPKKNSLVDFMRNNRKNIAQKTWQKKEPSQEEPKEAEGKQAEGKQGRRLKVSSEGNWELLEHYLIHKEEIPVYHEHAKEMIQDSLKKFISTEEGRRDLKRYDRLNQPSFIKEESRRVAKQLMLEDPSARELKELKSLGQMLDSPYFSDFKNVEGDENNDFLESIVRETLETEKNELESKLQDFVKKFHQNDQTAEEIKPDDFVASSKATSSETSDKSNKDEGPKHVVMSGPDYYSKAYEKVYGTTVPGPPPKPKVEEPKVNDHSMKDLSETQPLPFPLNWREKRKKKQKELDMDEDEEPDSKTIIKSKQPLIQEEEENSITELKKIDDKGKDQESIASEDPTAQEPDQVKLPEDSKTILKSGQSESPKSAPEEMSVRNEDDIQDDSKEVSSVVTEYEEVEKSASKESKEVGAFETDVEVSNSVSQTGPISEKTAEEQSLPKVQTKDEDDILQKSEDETGSVETPEYEEEKTPKASVESKIQKSSQSEDEEKTDKIKKDTVSPDEEHVSVDLSKKTGEDDQSLNEDALQEKEKVDGKQIEEEQGIVNDDIAEGSVKESDLVKKSEISQEEEASVNEDEISVKAEKRKKIEEDSIKEPSQADDQSVQEEVETEKGSEKIENDQNETEISPKPDKSEATTESAKDKVSQKEEGSPQLDEPEKIQIESEKGQPKSEKQDQESEETQKELDTKTPDSERVSQDSQKNTPKSEKKEEDLAEIDQKTDNVDQESNVNEVASEKSVQEPIHVNFPKPNESEQEVHSPKKDNISENESQESIEEEEKSQATAQKSETVGKNDLKSEKEESQEAQTQINESQKGETEEEKSKTEISEQEEIEEQGSNQNTSKKDQPTRSQADKSSETEKTPIKDQDEELSRASEVKEENVSNKTEQKSQKDTEEKSKVALDEGEDKEVEDITKEEDSLKNKIEQMDKGSAQSQEDTKTQEGEKFGIAEDESPISEKDEEKELDSEIDRKEEPSGPTEEEKEEELRKQLAEQERKEKELEQKRQEEEKRIQLEKERQQELLRQEEEMKKKIKQMEEEKKQRQAEKERQKKLAAEKKLKEEYERQKLKERLEEEARIKKEKLEKEEQKRREEEKKERERLEAIEKKEEELRLKKEQEAKKKAEEQSEEDSEEMELLKKKEEKLKKKMAEKKEKEDYEIEKLKKNIEEEQAILDKEAEMDKVKKNEHKEDQEKDEMLKILNKSAEKLAGNLQSKKVLKPEVPIPNYRSLKIAYDIRRVNLMVNKNPKFKQFNNETFFSAFKEVINTVDSIIRKFIKIKDKPNKILLALREGFAAYYLGNKPVDMGGLIMHTDSFSNNKIFRENLEVDFYMIVEVAQEKSGVLARAGPFAINREGRSTCGHTLINLENLPIPASNKLQKYSNIMTILHEVFHALAFNQAIYKKLPEDLDRDLKGVRPEDAKDAKTGKFDPSKNWMKLADTSSFKYLNMYHAIQKKADIFDDTGEHWNPSYLPNDLMIPVERYDAILSIFSLEYIEYTSLQEEYKTRRENLQSNFLLDEIADFAEFYNYKCQPGDDKAKYSSFCTNKQRMKVDKGCNSSYLMKTKCVTSQYLKNGCNENKSLQEDNCLSDEGKGSTRVEPIEERGLQSRCINGFAPVDISKEPSRETSYCLGVKVVDDNINFVSKQGTMAVCDGSNEFADIIYEQGSKKTKYRIHCPDLNSYRTKYEKTSCPNLCFGNGFCADGVCNCFEGFDSDTDCEKKMNITESATYIIE